LVGGGDSFPRTLTVDGNPYTVYSASYSVRGWEYHPEVSLTEARGIGSALTDVDGSPDGQILDHADQALGRLILYFQKKARMEAYLRACLAPVQTLENLLWSVLELQDADLDNLEGVHLDREGAIIGEARGDRTDAEYRPALRARILINRSDGKLGQLYEILELLIPGNAAKISTMHPAHILVTLDTEGATTQEEVARLLRQAKPAGVRLDVGFGGGTIGDVGGSPAGAVIGDVGGSPAGFLIGAVG
jgi:hypothetical protein